MVNTLEKFQQAILRIKENGTERTYYPPFCSFLTEYIDETLKRKIEATAEESNLSNEEKRIGFPDITVREDRHIKGWVEIKLLNEDLSNDKFQDQFDRYKKSLENVLFTNFKHWELWQWNTDSQPVKVDEITFDITDYSKGAEKKLETIILKFLEGKVYPTRTPKQLALALAKKTKLLSKQVEEALNKSNDNSDLVKLKKTFEKTLIQDIQPHQFANMVAETMAYSLFLAALEHSVRGNGVQLTLTNALDYLPTNVPILADLYSLIKRVAGTIPNIFKATQLLVDQLNASEIKKIHNKLIEHKPGEDPVIQFYEPFLQEYDPKEREARGVYYTPKPVVDYIVKSVDWILKNKFNKKNGLADDSIHLLDPATGTGTFLMSAIQEIHSNIKKENESIGDDMVAVKFNKVVLTHILKHFYGFELLIAPYAIAHLKLTLEIERLGFDFRNTKLDDDKDNDRFKVYLANTLDDPEMPPKRLFGFDSIPQESEKAREVKKDIPIVAIIGNPPYSVSSSNMGIKFITDLIEDYKHGCGVENEVRIAPIQDDYIKFIRFAHWKIEKLGQGTIAYITNNSYLDGLIHRAMRFKLLEYFDDIYVLNLHGNSKLGEKTPENKTDENVFAGIQTGVSITFFIKNNKKEGGIGKLFYADLYGKRSIKYQFLNDYSIETTKFNELKPKSNFYFFTNKNYILDEEYNNYYSLSNVFINYKLGAMTGKDDFVISYDKNILNNRLNDLISDKSESELRNKYSLSDSRDWKLSTARKIRIEANKFEKILYRPFDMQEIYYDDNLLASPQRNINRHLLSKNVGLLFSKQLGTTAQYTNWFVTNSITEMAVFKSAKSAARIAPLYLYPNKTSQNELIKVDSETTNYNKQFIKYVCKKLNVNFINYGRGNLDKTIGPEGIFYYIYGIFYSPTFRLRYIEQLKIDFPRLPLTSNKKLFTQLVVSGNELVNLHLLGNNPFDKSITIFDDKNKWKVKAITEERPDIDWKVSDVRYDEEKKRVYINKGQFIEGIEKDVWEFMIGGYQVCEKWLKDRKKAERSLSPDDLEHYMKIVVSLRETIRIMKDIDQLIDKHGGWPIK